jgi:hypothetical protein
MEIVHYQFHVSERTMPPKRYRKERKPIPKTNVAAIIPINRTLIFFLLIELDLLIEIKNPWSVYRPRVSKISLASATRLSKRFAWGKSTGGDL